MVSTNDKLRKRVERVMTKMKPDSLHFTEVITDAVIREGENYLEVRKAVLIIQKEKGVRWN